MAEALIAARRTDGASASGPFSDWPEDYPFKEDFVHVPDPIRGAAGNGTQLRYALQWGDVQPFGFAGSMSGSVAPVPGPPESTFDYATEHTDLNMLGAQRAAARTPQQLETGIFWAYDGEVCFAACALTGELLSLHAETA